MVSSNFQYALSGKYSKTWFSMNSLRQKNRIEKENEMARFEWLVLP